MKIYLKNLDEMQEVINTLVKNGFYQQDITSHEIKFIKSNGAHDELVPLWWETNRNISVDDEYSRKYFFVAMELKEVLKKINVSIENAYYTKQSDGEEVVTVVYRNGYKKAILVTADSLKAIAEDVIREI